MVVYTVSNVLLTILAVSHVIVNLLVIFLSIRRVRWSILRTYVLNLTIPSLAYSIYSVIVCVLRYMQMENQFVMRNDVHDVTFVDYAMDFFVLMCAYDYRFLAVNLVIIIYINFSLPVFAKKYLRTRNILLLFILGHFLAVTFSVITVYSEKQVENYYNNGKTVPVDWSDYFEAFGEIGTFVIFISCYVVCFHAIMAFQKRHASTTTINYRGNHLKSQVLAILFYITPLNVFIIPSSFCTDLFTAFLPWNLPIYREMCYLKVNYAEIFLAGRLFVASFTILIAFVDYRNAVLLLFRRKHFVNIAMNTSAMGPAVGIRPLPVRIPLFKLINNSHKSKKNGFSEFYGRLTG
ncbi:hypothetical protein L596_017680 [Steinernema carpocapsae]|uniref:G-protein coupled receptors family 1 profile domain-containing protein n=1 Tax=Steinernema carpocapsae TaxID=34508 RepID=A0A4U5N2M7_STECR|nr:hypothetical protein L596_017680 [Steinernema carpocapsae]